jgi:hypothetical protein
VEVLNVLALESETFDEFLKGGIIVPRKSKKRVTIIALAIRCLHQPHTNYCIGIKTNYQLMHQPAIFTQINRATEVKWSVMAFFSSLTAV